MKRKEGEGRIGREGRTDGRDPGREEGRERRNSWSLRPTASVRIMFQGTENGGRGGRGRKGDVEFEFTLLM